jgi:hypothetical protein
VMNIFDICGWATLGIIGVVHFVVVVILKVENWNTNWKYATWCACASGVDAILAAAAHALVPTLVIGSASVVIALSAEHFWRLSKRDKKDSMKVVDRNDMGW